MGMRLRSKFGLLSLVGFVAVCALVLWFFQPQDPVDRLRKGLRSENPDVRTSSINQLFARGPSVIPELIEELEGRNATGREMAGWVLSLFGAQAAPAVPALVDSLKDPEPNVRVMSALALSKIGPGATKDAIPVLVEALSDKNPLVRQQIADTLAAFGPDANAGISALVTVLQMPGEVDTEEVLPRQSASRALASIGAEAADQLIPLLGKDDQMLQSLCTETLSTMGRDIVPQLTPVLSDDNPQARWRAAQVLGRIGSQASDAVPDLKKMMEDKDGMCRVRAAEAVWKITKEADAVLGTLTAGLKSDEEAVARVAIVALREMGAAAEPVISEVTDALKSNDKAVRRDATLAIGSFARTNTAMIPLLIAALEDSESDVRRAAVDSLVRIGPPAAGAVEQLKKMGQDEVNIAVRRAAGNAARQIESGEQPKSRRRN